MSDEREVEPKGLVRQARFLLNKLSPSTFIRLLTPWAAIVVDSSGDEAAFHEILEVILQIAMAGEARFSSNFVKLCKATRSILQQQAGMLQYQFEKIVLIHARGRR
jgi:glyoxylate carboligase